MSKFDHDWIPFSNGVRLKRSNIVGYMRNQGEGFSRVITVNDPIAVDETPEEIDFLMGKTVSTPKLGCTGCLNKCEEKPC